MMTVGGAGVRRVGPFGWMPEGSVGKDREQGETGLRVFERQFPIDKFFM